MDFAHFPELLTIRKFSRELEIYSWGNREYQVLLTSPVLLTTRLVLQASRQVRYRYKQIICRL